MFDSVFYKAASKIPFVFKLVLRLHKVQIRGELILHVIHIAGTRIIEAGIYSISSGNNLGGMMRGLNLSQFFPLDQGAVVRLAKLEPWIRTWWGESLSSLSGKYWFEHKGGNIMWDPPPAEAETALELFLESRIKLPYKSHVMVVPRLMIFPWINQMGKEANLLFIFPVGVPCWGLG